LDSLKLAPGFEKVIAVAGLVTPPALPEALSQSVDAGDAPRTSEAVSAAGEPEFLTKALPQIAGRALGSTDAAGPLSDAQVSAAASSDTEPGGEVRASAMDARQTAVEGAVEWPQARSEGSSRPQSADGVVSDAELADPRPAGAAPTDAERPSGISLEVMSDPSRPLHVPPDVRSPDAPVPTGAASRSDDAGPPPARQLAEVAQRLPDGPVEISLSPEELGKVRMSLLGGEGQMTVQIVAERPETLDLLRRHIDLLASELRQQGFTDLSFSFGQGGTSTDGAYLPAGGGSDAVDPTTTDDLSAIQPESGRSRGAGGLDLRI
jgi:hypothetical protein